MKKSTIFLIIFVVVSFLFTLYTVDAAENVNVALEATATCSDQHVSLVCSRANDGVSGSGGWDSGTEVNPQWITLKWNNTNVSIVNMTLNQMVSNGNTCAWNLTWYDYSQSKWREANKTNVIAGSWHFYKYNFTPFTTDYINFSCTDVASNPGIHEIEVWNGTIQGGTTPPEITYYNLTNENGCENWVTDKTNACSTSSVTPTVQFNTNENAWCAISGNSSSTSGMNYTDMGSSRNCTGAMSGEGGTINHRCTLISQDELVYDTSYLYISCKDANNNQNRTSTSGPLRLSITGLESAGRDSIVIGIQNALLSGYTNYTDLQIYARNLSNAQAKGTFDRAAKKGNKMWAFNRIGVSDSYVNMFNLTPVLYNLELANKTSINITKQVELLINATK